MLRTARNVARLIRIARTLARHDAIFPLERLGVAPGFVAAIRVISRRSAAGRPGERLALALQRLGPSFIKLGQALSTRADLIGDEVAADLSALQDRLPPFPGDEARATVAEQLGAEVDELFSSFEDAPVAAASIAQVHFATTTEGEEVAVKVLRPGIEEAFARDLELFYWLAAMVERALPGLARLKPLEVVASFAETVRIEMDLRLEAAAASELRENFADDPSYRVPRVDWQRTARRVLTLERVSGIPIDERERLIAAGHDVDRVLETAANAVFTQVFRDGFFHADLHPGNLFVAADSAVIAVDFGIMGRLDRETRYYLADMLLGFLQGDYRLVAEVHFRAGYVPPNQSKDAFAQACRSIAEPILGQPLHEISLAKLLAHLFQVTKTFEMETQPQLLLLQKTMLVAEGVGRILNPQVNMWELARPLVEDWMRENRGAEARLREAAADAAETLQRLPRFLDNAEKAAQRLAEGRLTLAPEPRPGRRPGERHPLYWPLWALAALVAVLVVALV